MADTTDSDRAAEDAAVAEVARLAGLATFDYYGETLHYAQEWPHFEWTEFQMELAEDDVSEARARGVALRTAIACIDPVDRGKFRTLSRKHHAQLDDWMKVLKDWTAAEAGRPTGLSTDTSDGHASTSESSASQPVASVTSLPAVPAKAAKRPPRGDLGLAVARSAALA